MGKDHQAPPTRPVFKAQGIYERSVSASAQGGLVKNADKAKYIGLEPCAEWISGLVENFESIP